MRVLCTFVGGEGHFLPVNAVATAVEEAGHTVAFACGPQMADTVRAAGADVIPIGSGHPSTPQRGPMLPVDVRREEHDVRERFIRGAARRRVPEMRRIAEGWMPDVMVSDEMDFGSLMAAEQLAIPYATVQVLAAASFLRPDVVAEALDEVRAEHGLLPDPALDAAARHLLLVPFPRVFRDPSVPVPVTAHMFRTERDVADTATAPPWTVSRPDAPTVYATLGTVFNMESGDLFFRMLHGLRDLPINVVVTVGRHINPEEFGAQPDHVHIVRYLPQSDVLAHCDVVVSHGGSGSVIGALAHGLPMVLLPMGGDQIHNAERCTALGVGHQLDANRATSAQIGSAVRDILTQPGAAAAAAAVRDQIRDQPGPESTVALLERLVVDD